MRADFQPCCFHLREVILQCAIDFISRPVYLAGEISRGSRCKASVYDPVCRYATYKVVT